MDKKIEVGDTVVIRGVVREIVSESVYIDTIAKPGLNSKYQEAIHVSRISEVIPKPWVPKEGDTIWHTATHMPYIFRAAIDDMFVYEQQPGKLSMYLAKFFQKDKPE